MISSSAIFATKAAKASSPSPVSTMMFQPRPEVWLSRFRTVISSAAVSSGWTNSGTYRRTGASSSTRPSATRRISATAVKVFVAEPSWNSVSLSTGSGLSRLVTPWHAYTSLPSIQTPTAAPGMPDSLTVAPTNSDSASYDIPFPFPWPRRPPQRLALCSG